jgi:hypothetical protein
MALGRRGLRQQQEQFAAGLGQGAFAQQRALAGDLGATILGRPSSAINLGGQLLGQAQTGAAGQMGPQLYDPKRLNEPTRLDFSAHKHRLMPHVAQVHLLL